MITLSKMLKILFEKDEEKQKRMIDELPEAEKEKLITEAEKLAVEGRRIVEKYRK